MSDDFLLVMNEDWSEVLDAAPQILNNIGETTLQNLINDSAWSDIQTAFGDTWSPPEGYQLVGAKLINDGGVRFYVKLVPAV